jgi:hypothetical protein
MVKGNLIADEAEEFTDNLSSLQIKARAKLEQRLKERGLNPMTVEQLRAMGDLWPEDENVDEFLAAVREWRKGEPSRRLP